MKINNIFPQKKTVNKEYPVIHKTACLNGLILKIIAVTAMVIDHTAAIFFPQITVLRIIGRLAFPLFAFLLIEGYCNTKNIRKYECRLLVFAVISEIPFDLAINKTAFYPSYQNVFFTLLIGLVMLDVITSVTKRISNGTRALIVEFVIIACFAVAAFFIRSDFGAYGVLIIYCLYRFRDIPIINFSLFAVLVILFNSQNPMPEYFAMLSIIPFILYNGQRGFVKINGPYEKKEQKIAYQATRYMFYAFYPVHLLVLYFISLYAM